MPTIPKQHTYTSQSFTETGSEVGLVATGTWVLVTHFSVTMPTAGNLGILENGAGTDFFKVMAGANGDAISCDFPHPILSNGLGVVTSAGTGTYTVCWTEV